MILPSVTLAAIVVAAFASGETFILLDDAGAWRGSPWLPADAQCSQSAIQGGFHHNHGVLNGEDFAKWDFTVPKDGCYWVEEFHPDTTKCGLNLHSRVPVHIDFCKGMYTGGFVDQSQFGDQWNKLVRLPFYTSSRGTIRISAKGLCDRLTEAAQGIWAADAFRLTWNGTDDCLLEGGDRDNAVAPPTNEESTELVVPTVENEVLAVEKEVEKEVGEVVTKLALKDLPLHQTLVDDLDADVHGSTREPVSQCPVTGDRTFHHDGLQKGRRAEATFHFHPPRDGCYLVEEMHPELDQCKASANTKVHVVYGTGLEAVGKVDQTLNAGQWTFVAARPFYAGQPGKVTLSNEGTEPGTLAVFDRVRFTWSGKTCTKVASHPRQTEIRMTVDFQIIADRQAEFASAFKSKLAGLAEVPEQSLRLISLRPGSIIAELLVLPSVVDGPLNSGLSAVQTVEKLRNAVAKNAADLCAVTGGQVEGCNVEFKDLGIAKAGVAEKTERKPSTCGGSDDSNPTAMIAVVVGGAVGLLSILVIYHVFRAKARKAKQQTDASTNKTSDTVDHQVTASMEEGKSLDDKKVDDESDKQSTDCPSSDAQSDTNIADETPRVDDGPTPATLD